MWNTPEERIYVPKPSRVSSTRSSHSLVICFCHFLPSFPLFPLSPLYPPPFFVARLPTLVLCATYTMIWKEKHKMGSLLWLLHFRDRWSFTDEKCAVSGNSRMNKKKRDRGIKTLLWPLNKIVRSAMTTASVYLMALNALRRQENQKGNGINSVGILFSSSTCLCWF